VIIDFHTHIFPPDVAANREEYVRRDPTFAEMYADPRATIATAEDLLAAMDKCGVDISVALGFAWREHNVIIQHNEYLLDVAARSDGRIIPFTSANLADPRAEHEIERCAADGVRGLGELRPENQGWDLSGQPGDLLATLARKHDLVLSFHVTEPGGRNYPGRHGCALETFTAFATKNPGLRIVGSHLGGGVYTHGSSPPDVHVDTAAQPFLYRGEEAHAIMRAVPPGRLMFGSDYSLIAQKRQIDEIAGVFHDLAERDAVLGGNAAHLLRLHA
jgi:predicted TIM-barrel fold metal-dependent hydrolase